MADEGGATMRLRFRTDPDRTRALDRQRIAEEIERQRRKVAALTGPPPAEPPAEPPVLRRATPPS
jgi:hypothetical protein